MKEESKKSLKVLSKVLEIVTIVGKVCSIIAIPCIALVMICTPYFVNNVNVSDKKLSFKVGKTNVVLLEEGKNDARLKAMVDGKVVSENEEAKIVDMINDALKNTSKTNVIICVELALAFGIATIIFSIIVMNYAIKFFKNLGNKQTPFIEENVLYLRKMGIYMIVAFALPIVSNVIIDLISGYDIGTGFEMYNAIEILVLFILSYIFEYGMELQSKSKKTLYETEKK